MKNLFLIIVAALVVLLLLFDLRIDWRFEMPQSEQLADPAQEARFEACVQEREEEIHAQTFARVDNPDVQRELLYRRMQAATTECRERFPEQMITVETPFRFNLFDAEFRF